MYVTFEQYRSPLSRARDCYCGTLGDFKDFSSLYLASGYSVSWLQCGQSSAAVHRWKCLFSVLCSASYASPKGVSYIVLFTHKALSCEPEMKYCHDAATEPG